MGPRMVSDVQRHGSRTAWRNTDSGVAVALADLAVSPVDKYVALRDAIVVSAFMGLGHTYATQGHEADESGCVHWHWAEVSCPILLDPWRRGTAPSPRMVADLAY